MCKTLPVHLHIFFFLMVNHSVSILQINNHCRHLRRRHGGSVPFIWYERGTHDKKMAKEFKDVRRLI